MGSGEIGIEFRGEFEFRVGVFDAAFGFVEHAEVVMRDRLIGDELRHALELLDGFERLAHALVLDAEVEPCVRDGGVFLLDFLEDVDAVGNLAGAEEGETVVELVDDGVRVHLDGKVELFDGFVLGGGVLIIGFAEGAEALEAFFALPGAGLPEAEDDEGKEGAEGAAKGKTPFVHLDYFVIWMAGPSITQTYYLDKQGCIRRAPRRVVTVEGVGVRREPPAGRADDS